MSSDKYGCALLTETRKVKSAYCCMGNDWEWHYMVGRNDVTGIRIVGVAGQCGHVPWFEIERTGRPLLKVAPAGYVEVEFEDDD